MVHEMLEEGVQVSALSLPRLMTPHGDGCLQTLAKLEEREERTPWGDGGEHQGPQETRILPSPQGKGITCTLA